MDDKRKTKSQLIDELVALRQQNVEIKKTETDDIRAKAEADGSIKYAERILETMREPLLVLDSNLKILFANRSFYNVFKVTQNETLGSFIYDLGNKQWDIPRLRLLLEAILSEKKKFEGFKVDHHYSPV